MKCICCGRVINEPSLEESKNQWHKRCVKKFFGTGVMPEFNTIGGNYLPGYFIKHKTGIFPNRPEAEYAVMRMAQISKIATVPFALLFLNGEYVYITKRMDRVLIGENVKKLAMEDFCQLDGLLSKDRYSGSYERCGQIVGSYSSRAGLDQTELFLRIVFSFLTGNSDMHMKKFSLVETKVAEGAYILSPAYGLIPSNVMDRTDCRQMALSLNGKTNDICRNDFLSLAMSFGIPEKVADRLIASLLKNYDLYIEICKEALMPDEIKTELIHLIGERIKILAQ